MCKKRSVSYAFYDKNRNFVADIKTFNYGRNQRRMETY